MSENLPFKFSLSNPIRNVIVSQHGSRIFPSKRQQNSCLIYYIAWNFGPTTAAGYCIEASVVFSEQVI